MEQNSQVQNTSVEPQQLIQQTDKKKHLPWKIIVFCIVFLVLLVSTFLFLQKNLGSKSYIANNKKTITSSPTPMPVVINNFDVVSKRHPGSTCPQYDQCTDDIYLKDKTTGKENFFITLEDINENSYPSPVYHNGKLFILRRIGNTQGHMQGSEYVDGNWQDELWVYDSQGKGKKLYGAQGLDFRADSSATNVALLPTQGTTKVIMLNLQTMKTISYAISFKENPSCDGESYLDNWNAQGTIIWGDTFQESTTLCYFNLNRTTNKITLYPFQTMVNNVGQVIAFNPDEQLVVYIDKFFQFDVEHEQMYEASGKNYTMFLYNLLTKQNAAIHTFPFTWQETKIQGTWDTTTQFSYSSPDGTRTYTLANNYQQTGCHYELSACPNSPNRAPNGGFYPCDPIQILVCPSGTPSPQKSLTPSQDSSTFSKDKCPCWDSIHNVCLPQKDCE